MDPASIHLPSGQSGSTTLTLHIAPGAAVGTRTLFFSESAFDGAQHDSVVPGATLTIGVGQVLL